MGSGRTATARIITIVNDDDTTTEAPVDSGTAAPSGRDDVALQIDEIRESSPAEVTVTVRNLRGPVSRGAHFTSVSDRQEPIDLQLVRILWYRREVDHIPAGHTALITLRGSGVQALRPGTLTDGWQRIEGRNPPA